MRWFVEITSLANAQDRTAPASRLTVEAATWQGALAQARNVQKDTAPLSNFTIEVLPDGYRATNGVARMRYVVSKAPDDAPLQGVQPASREEPEPPRPSAPPESKPDSKPDSKSPAALAAAALGRRSKPPQAPAPAAPATAAAPVERGKIILRKAEDPGTRSPLTYREVAVAVVPSTPQQLAIAIARANLDDIKQELASAPPGKLVQLAVFDHEWTGRPQRAPLVALTWKDWRGDEPEVKLGGAPASVPTPAATTVPTGAPTSTTKTKSEPPPRPIVDASTLASEISSAVAAARPPKPTPSSPEIPAAIESFVSSGSIQVVQPAAPPPAPKSAPPPPPPAPAAPPPSAPEPVRDSKRPDDLVSEIFESMHDVHFMRDALDGADFVLELLREKIPTRVALVHFYDINKKEFVVVKARAPRPDVVSTRTAEGSGLIGAAVKSAKPIFVTDAAQDQRWQRDRYAQAGHPEPRQIVVVPMRQGGRFLGALELADHLDGQPFGDNEIHALSYVADQFGEFVGDRGIKLIAGDTGSFQVLDPSAVRLPR